MSLSGRHFLSVKDLTREELVAVLDLARKMKASKRGGEYSAILSGKALALIFQKPSTRTRISFEVGMYQLGGKTVNLTGSEIKLGEREAISDISRVVSRYVDGVMIRALYQSDIVEFAKYSSVPVINGLSDLYHPCQAVSDMMTIEERFGAVDGLRMCYIGDGNNVCNSLIDACSLLGIKLTVCCPKGYEPPGEDRRAACTISYKPQEAVEGSHVIYTDVWTSMGQEEETQRRLRDFKNFTVTAKLMSKADSKAIFMHCLPAHREEEVEESVIEGAQSVVFDQAENRLHAQKAILSMLMS